MSLVCTLFSLLYISIHRYFMCAQSWNSESSLARDFILLMIIIVYLVRMRSLGSPSPKAPPLSINFSQRSLQWCVM